MLGLLQLKRETPAASTGVFLICGSQWGAAGGAPLEMMAPTTGILGWAPSSTHAATSAARRLKRSASCPRVPLRAKSPLAAAQPGPRHALPRRGPSGPSPRPAVENPVVSRFSMAVADSRRLRSKCCNLALWTSCPLQANIAERQARPAACPNRTLLPRPSTTRPGAPCEEGKQLGGWIC